MERKCEIEQGNGRNSKRKGGGNRQGKVSQDRKVVCSGRRDGIFAEFCSLKGQQHQLLPAFQLQG